jgi:hypothetical protein
MNDINERNDNLIADDLSEMQHLVMPIFIKQGIFLYLDREVDRLAPVGALLAEPISVRVIGLSARCQLQVQISDDQTESYCVDLSWDDELRKICGTSVSTTGKVIDIQLVDSSVELSVNAPRGVSIAGDRHILSGLRESNMEKKLDAAINQLSRENGLSVDALAELPLTELQRRFVLLDEQLRYAKRRIHHLRTQKKRQTAGELSYAQLFKTLADAIAVQAGLLKAEIARHVDVNFH